MNINSSPTETHDGVVPGNGLLTRRSALLDISAFCVAPIVPAFSEPKPETTRYATYNGSKVAYESHGTGKTALIFVHGWTCSKELWRGQAPLYTKYRSILVDLPGHGASDAPEIDYNQEMFGHALNAVLEQESIEEAVFVGHSMGGPVSSMAIRLFPAKAKGIVYVDTFLRSPEDFLTMTQRKDYAVKLADDAFFSMLIDRGCFSEATTDEVKTKIRKAMLGTNRRVRVAAVTSNSLAYTYRFDEKYDIPAHHIHVPNRPIPTDWVTHFPQLENEPWTGHGHFLFMEDPTRFNASVDNFLKTKGLLKS